MGDVRMYSAMHVGTVQAPRKAPGAKFLKRLRKIFGRLLFQRKYTVFETSLETF